MKIDFVIPAYNEEALIGRCLDAIHAELGRGDYAADVVVVNNASTDGTAEIVRRYPTVRLIDEPQKGLVKARQAGYVATTGEIIANIDADCAISEGWIDKVLREFKRDKRLVALSGPFHYEGISRVAHIVTMFYYTMGYGIYWLQSRVLRSGAMLQGGNFVVRRTAMEEIGGFDTSIEFYGEDTDVARRISRVGRVKWTFRLPAHSSARRLKAEGFLTTGMRYALNFLSTSFTGRIVTKTHTDIRPDETCSDRKADGS